MNVFALKKVFTLFLSIILIQSLILLMNRLFDRLSLLNRQETNLKKKKFNEIHTGTFLRVLFVKQNPQISAVLN